MAKRRRRYHDKKPKKHEREVQKAKLRSIERPEEIIESDESLKRRHQRERVRSRRKDFMVIAIAVIFIFAVIGGYLVFNKYFSPEEENNEEEYTPIPTPNPTDLYKIPSFTASNPSNSIVIIEVRDYGSIVVELYNSQVIRTVNNFLEYVRQFFYNGLIFHRVMDGFVIQGGGFDTNLNEKPTLYPPIPLEIDSSLTHVDGALAMARTNDPDSATCQFYICDGPQHSLDDAEMQKVGSRGYAVFGQVIGNLEIVRKISQVPVHTENGMENVPVNDVIINRIYEYFE